MAARPDPIERDPAGRQGVHGLATVCIALSLAALLVPPLLVPMPPLMDWPNHAARLWLIAGGIATPPLDAIYAVDWTATSTNLGPDLLAKLVGPLIGTVALERLLVAAAVVLPPLGAVMLNRALFGGWHWWQAGFAVLAWNSTLLGGFIAFQSGLGLALLAAAADVALSRRAGRAATLAFRFAACALLIVWHVFAASFFAALLVGLALGPGFRAFAARQLRETARPLGAALLAVALAFLLFLLLAPRPPGGHAPDDAFAGVPTYSIGGKVAALLSGIATYDVPLDILAVVLAYLAARVLGRDALRTHRGLLLAALGLIGLALVTPAVLAGTSVVDGRFSIMALLAAAAAIRPDAASPRRVAVAAAILLAIGLARTGWILDIWQARQADVQAVRTALAAVPAGAAVLPAERVSDAPGPRGRRSALGFVAWLHLPALAVPERHAFVPTLFATPGHQPLRVLGPWTGIAAQQGQPVPFGFLAGFGPSTNWQYLAGYAQHWRTRFDYVLLLNADLPPAEAEPVLPELDLVTDAGFARLYRIRRDGR